MALDIDGAAVLKAIVASPELFTDLRADLARTARSLVVKQLKAKSTTVDRLRALRASVGEKAFALIVDGLADADLRTISGKVDGAHADLAEATPAWCRRHLLALASGASKPAPLREPARSPAATALDIGSLRHESVQAKPKRRSRLST